MKFGRAHFLLIPLLLAVGTTGGEPAAPLAVSATAPTPTPLAADDLQTLIRENEKAVLVLNFWATWCPPCIEEFPDFVRLSQEYQDEGVNVVFVSADFAEDVHKVTAFLTEQGITGETYIRTGKDQDLIAVLPAAWSGALPATFIYGQGQGLLYFHQGRLTYEQLNRLVQQALEQTTSNTERSLP
jgi:thiol-disulfide isomerase/thioredoxin